MRSAAIARLIAPGCPSPPRAPHAHAYAGGLCRATQGSLSLRRTPTASLPAHAHMRTHPHARSHARPLLQAMWKEETDALEAQEAAFERELKAVLAMRASAAQQKVRFEAGNRPSPKAVQMLGDDSVLRSSQQLVSPTAQVNAKSLKMLGDSRIAPVQARSPCYCPRPRTRARATPDPCEPTDPRTRPNPSATTLK